MRGNGGRWILLLFVPLIVAGCWDRREIEERSTSLATGVDICAEGADCRIIATRQLAIPGRIPVGGAGGGGREGSTVLVISSPGQDGPDTARKAQMELNRQLSFGHTRVVIWSEAFTRRGAKAFIDYIRRDPEARRLMWIAVSEGPAEDVIRAKPPLERVPALFLSDMIDDAVKTGRMPRVAWGDFLVRLSNEGEEAIAPLVRMVGPDEPQLAGLAVFRGDRMVGKLSPQETATYMQLQGRRQGAELLDIELPEGRHAVVRVFNRIGDLKPRWMGGRIHASATMDLETELVQLSPDLDSSTPRVIAMIERHAEEEITRNVEALVKKLQEQFGADILALGERVRAYLPEVWSSIADWPAAFADARFDFKVKVYLRRTGMAED